MENQSESVPTQFRYGLSLFENGEFDADGPGGNVADVIQNLGTDQAFTPTAYSDAIINDLIASAGIDLTDVEIRIRRSANNNT